jgi:hypothetical protein
MCYYVFGEDWDFHKNTALVPGGFSFENSLFFALLNATGGFLRAAGLKNTSDRDSLSKSIYGGNIHNGNGL